MPSPIAGTVTKIHVKKGTRSRSARLLTVDQAGAGAAEPPQPDAAAEADRARPTKAARREGERPHRREPSREPAKPRQPRPTADAVEPTAAEADDAAEPPRSGCRPQPPSAQQAAACGPARPAAPAVRRLAASSGVDLQRGHRQRPGRPHHRGRRQGFRDVTRSLGGGDRAAGAAARQPAGAAGLRAVGRRRTQAADGHPPHDRRAPWRTPWTTIPHVTQYDDGRRHRARSGSREVPRPDGREAGRQAHGDRRLRSRPSPRALKEFPRFNAIDRRGAEQIVYKQYVPHRRRRRHRARPARAGDPRRRPEEHPRARRSSCPTLAEKARTQADASTRCRAARSRSPTWAASAARTSRRSSTRPRWRSWASRAAGRAGV